MSRAFLGTYFSRLACRLAPHPFGRLPANDGQGGTAESEAKTLHLSFDDGPTDAGTPRLLEVLAKFGVPASFFLVGENAHRHPKRVREIIAAGHAVGNHSWSHINSWSSPVRATIRDFAKCQSELESITSASVRWLRPPFGYLTKPVVKWCKRHGIQTVLWDNMPPDFTPGKTSDDIVSSFRARLRDRSVVCLHDNSTSLSVTPAALERLIPELLDGGWQFHKLRDDSAD